jgi:starch-binding outer membrane protein, SusD/RagB family
MRLKQFIAPLALSAGLAAIGCTDLLNEDPKGFATTEAFYKTGADLNSATLATYSALRGLEGQSNWTTIELASDQARADNREPNAGTYGPDRLDWDASTGRTDQYWATMYSVITRANLVIAKGPGVATGYEAMRTYNLAEAKFLRGYAYLWLTKTYDDVPLLLSPEDQANPRPTRTPVAQVHQAVIRDLSEAEAALPVTWGASDAFGVPTQGRATRGAAQMALADLYQWRASFLDSGKVAAEWQLASDWADSVLTSGAWALNDDYIKTFLPIFKGSREMILVITNSGRNDRSSNIFQLFYYPRDWGLDLGQGGGWGLIHPTDWFYASYLPGDYRRSTGRDFTSQAAYVDRGCSFSGVCPGDPPSADSVFRDGPMSWKYRKSDNGATWWLGDVDVPLYRFAEAILIYAEAQNELGNPAVAAQYLNMIRARARKGTGSESRTEPHDYGTGSGELVDKLPLRDAIFMERAWEFAFEGKRWFDLVRRDSEEPGYWKSSLEQHDPNANAAGKLVAFRKRFPIPQAQRNVNPSLTQNPGY